MLKKFLSVIIVIIMVSTFLPITSFADDDILSYLTYKIENNEVCITLCDKTIVGDIVIPEEIEGFPVTELGWAFMDCLYITSVVIPDSVKTIHEGAFIGCEQLKTVKFGSGITVIEQFMFVNCKSLESIDIPDNITEIRLAAFEGCSALKTINIGKGWSEFDCTIFRNCTNLERIIVDPENKNFSSDENGVLFNKDKTILLYYPRANTSEKYVIPETVETVEYDAFVSCNFLKEIEVPKSVTRVYGAITGTSLEKITFYNKNCLIDFETETIPESVVICGYTDSVAEEYADQFNRKFTALDDDIFSAFIRLVKSYIDFIVTVIKNFIKML